MIDPPYLPLVRLKSSEEGLTWEEFSSDPMLLFDAFAKSFAVKANTVNDNIIKSSKKPLAKDRGKLWIKESWPYAYISLIDGEWKADYGPSGFMPDSPFLHKPFTPALEYVRILDSAELTKYGLTDTISASTATERMRWHIFEPPKIEI